MTSNGSPIVILLADDDEDDRMMTEDAFRRHRLANEFHAVVDGEELMDFLKRRGKHKDAPRPDIILLDLNLPKKDGREVLSEIKQDENLRYIPVVILTTSKAEEDVLKSYHLHANCYVTKPVDLEKFITVVQSIDRFWLTVVTLPNAK